MLAERPPPVSTTGTLGRLRENLFSNWFNTVLTLLALYLMWTIIPPFIDWAFIHADGSGGTGRECTTEGACWAWLDQRDAQFPFDGILGIRGQAFAKIAVFIRFRYEQISCIDEFFCGLFRYRSLRSVCKSPSGDLSLDQFPEHAVDLHQFAERAGFDDFSGL